MEPFLAKWMINWSIVSCPTGVGSSGTAAPDWLKQTHQDIEVRICVNICVQDQQTDLILQLTHRLGREVSGWDEPLPLLLLLQQLQDTALNELLLPQLLLHLHTHTHTRCDGWGLHEERGAAGTDRCFLIYRRLKQLKLKGDSLIMSESFFHHRK